MHHLRQHLRRLGAVLAQLRRHRIDRVHQHRHRQLAQVAVVQHTRAAAPPQTSAAAASPPGPPTRSAEPPAATPAAARSIATHKQKSSATHANRTLRIGAVNVPSACVASLFVPNLIANPSFRSVTESCCSTMLYCAAAPEPPPAPAPEHAAHVLPSGRTTCPGCGAFMPKLPRNLVDPARIGQLRLRQPKLPVLLAHLLHLLLLRLNLVANLDRRKCCHTYTITSTNNTLITTENVRISRRRSGSSAFTSRVLSMCLAKNTSGVGPRRARRCSSNSSRFRAARVCPAAIPANPESSPPSPYRHLALTSLVSVLARFCTCP